MTLFLPRGCGEGTTEYCRWVLLAGVWTVVLAFWWKGHLACCGTGSLGGALGIRYWEAVVAIRNKSLSVGPGGGKVSLFFQFAGTKK
jgi:hypothetical protein